MANINSDLVVKVFGDQANLKTFGTQSSVDRDNWENIVKGNDKLLAKGFEIEVDNNNKCCCSEDTCCCSCGDPTELSKVNVSYLNSILNYITNLLKTNYSTGLAPWVYNLQYPKGALVYYEGNTYISLKDINEDIPTNKESWLERDFTTLSYIDPTSRLPIGSRLTVPAEAQVFGYIDYVSGETFNKFLYSDLYKVLGTDTFPEIENDVVKEVLPIGFTTYSFNREVPKGWKLWEVKKGNLAGSSILNLFKRIAGSISDRNIKSIWDKAVKDQTFPEFPSQALFIRGLTAINSVVGEFNEESIKAAFQGSFELPPILYKEFQNFDVRVTKRRVTGTGNTVDQTNSSTSEASYDEIIQYTKPIKINPLTGNPIEKEITLHSIVSEPQQDTNLTKGNPAKQFIYGGTLDSLNELTGSYSMPFNTKVNLDSEKLYNLGNETVPSHLTMYLIVKVDDIRTVTNGNGFKTIIKAYDSIDTKPSEVTLKINEFVNNAYTYIDNIKNQLLSSVENTISKLQSIDIDKLNKITNKSTPILDQILNQDKTSEILKQLLDTQGTNKVLEAILKNNENNKLVETLLAITESNPIRTSSSLTINNSDSISTKYVGGSDYYLGSPDKFLHLYDENGVKYSVPLFRLKN